MSARVSFSIPSLKHFLSCIGMPKASADRMVSLCAASMPSMSKLGSASAYQLERIADDFGLFPGNLLGPVKGFVGDLRDLDRATGAALDLVGVAAEHVPRAAPDRADAQQPYINWLHFVSGGIGGGA